MMTLQFETLTGIEFVRLNREALPEHVAARIESLACGLDEAQEEIALLSDRYETLQRAIRALINRCDRTDPKAMAATLGVVEQVMDCPELFYELTSESMEGGVTPSWRK